MNEQQAPKASKEGIAAIVMVGVVGTICILACAVVMIAFILNAPRRIP